MDLFLSIKLIFLDLAFPSLSVMLLKGSLLYNEIYQGSKFDQSSGSSLLPGISCFSKGAHHLHGQKINVAQRGGTDFFSDKLTDSRLDGDVPDTAATEDRLITDIAATAHQRSLQIDNKPKDVEANNKAVGELKKLDSFGRWMDKEIGGDCNDSLMASDSGKYWNMLGAENDDKEGSSLSHHMQLDVESMGPSLSQEPLFTIHDFSPDWAFSCVETKEARIFPVKASGAICLVKLEFSLKF